MSRSYTSFPPSASMACSGTVSFCVISESDTSHCSYLSEAWSLHGSNVSDTPWCSTASDHDARPVKWGRRWLSSGRLCRVVCYKLTNVLEELTAFIIRETTTGKKFRGREVKGSISANKVFTAFNTCILLLDCIYKKATVDIRHDFFPMVLQPLSEPCPPLYWGFLITQN
jgi:hypothetical protein